MKRVAVEQSRMRKAIARRMVDSKQSIPHFYVQADVPVDGVQARAALLQRDSGQRVTMTTALARACALTLVEHPEFNGHWTEDGLVLFDEIELGIAVALSEGLIAPALHGPHLDDTVTLAQRLDDLATRARNQGLRSSELNDATFTLSNLGMYDVVAFTAIIPPPQLAILATARPSQQWSFANERAQSALVMRVTLSADHRAVDGSQAARFLESFKGLFADPEGLLP